MSEPPIYQFGNGVCVRRGDLLELQLTRYATPGNPNLHEPVEEEWLGRVMGQINSPSPVFLDVGAGIGYYSTLVKKKWPLARVFAVEALPKHAEALRQTLVLNGIDPSAVTLIPEAVGTRNGAATFRDDGYGSRLAGMFERKNSIRVRTRRLDDILLNIGPVDAMKLDIQGSELAVLKSAKKSLKQRLVKYLIIGTHGAKIHSALVRYLSLLHYQILFEDPAPPMQPDGLIVASVFSGKK